MVSRGQTHSSPNGPYQIGSMKAVNIRKILDFSTHRRNGFSEDQQILEDTLSLEGYRFCGLLSDMEGYTTASTWLRL